MFIFEICRWQSFNARFHSLHQQLLFRSLIVSCSLLLLMLLMEVCWSYFFSDSKWTSANISKDSCIIIISSSSWTLQNEVRTFDFLTRALKVLRGNDDDAMMVSIPIFWGGCFDVSLCQSVSQSFDDFPLFLLFNLITRGKFRVGRVTGQNKN